LPGRRHFELPLRRGRLQDARARARPRLPPAGERAPSPSPASVSIPDPLWCYETIPAGYADFAPSNRYVREIDDIIHWDQFDKARLRNDREVIDYIIEKLRPKKKVKA
jgi:hypothetical protein